MYQNVKDAPNGRDLFVNLLMDVCVILIGKLWYTILCWGNIRYAMQLPDKDWSVLPTVGWLGTSPKVMSTYDLWTCEPVIGCWTTLFSQITALGTCQTTDSHDPGKFTCWNSQSRRFGWWKKMNFPDFRCGWFLGEACHWFFRVDFFWFENRNWNSTWLCLRRKLPDFHRVSYTLGHACEVFWQSKVAREFHGPSYIISWGVAKTL